MQDFLSVPIPAGWRASCSGKPAAALYSAPQPCCSSSAENFHYADGAVYADFIAGLDQLGGAAGAYHTGDAELPGHHGGVGQSAA